MLMFATILFTSLLALALCAAAFSLATASSEARGEPRPERKLALDPPRFFAAAAQPDAASQVPLELLLRDVERHIRLEQAAAEAYLDLPTRDALHSPSASSLAN